MKRFLILTVIFLLSVAEVFAQFVDCSSGLLQMPSADMKEAGVFTITNNFLNQHSLPRHNGSYASGWYYNTFGYGFGITFWSRLEIVYALVIFDEKNHPYEGQDYRSSILFNQDRHFVAKVLVLKEGEIRKWTPSIAVGVSDPVSGSFGDYVSGKVGEQGNGHFFRAYAVATKHFNTEIGDISTNLGYQYSFRTDYDRNGPLAAVSWLPVWFENRWFSPKFILEYDAYKVNFGFIASIWDNRFEAMFDLQGFRWISFGLRCNIRLKGE